MAGQKASRRAGLAVVLAAALIVSGCFGRHTTEEDRLRAQGSYELATQHIDKREYAPALTLLQQANTLDPNVPVYRNALGVVLLQLGRPDLARAEFVRATENDRDYAEALLNLGISHAELGQWADAITAYERAIKSPRLVSPDVAYHNLGLALFHLQRYGEAESALRFAISLDPELAPGYYHLGLVMLATDRKNDARTAFRRARELAPNSPFGQAAVERLKTLGDGG
jgi:Flp pilus assembly protein TadD